MIGFSFFTVHRDLRPENLLIKKISDSKLLLIISDFGISKRVESDKTVTTAEHRGNIDWIPHEIAWAKFKKIPVQYVCLANYSSMYEHTKMIVFLTRLKLSIFSQWGV